MDVTAGPGVEIREKPIMRGSHKNEIRNAIDWVSRHLNKKDRPKRIGRQELYSYNDDTVINIKISNRAVKSDGTQSEHYWIGLSYDIVDRLLEASVSAFVIQLADAGKYIVVPREQINEIHNNVKRSAGKRRYDIAIWPDRGYQAAFDGGRHFDWSHYCYEDQLLPTTTAAYSQIAEEWPSDTRGYVEGSVDRIEVNKYERDPRARAECLKYHKAACAACGCDLSLIYGDDLLGFIHIHHIVPISSLGKGYRINPKDDLIPLCPNCHAVVHRFTPPLTMEQLRGRLSARRSS